MPTNLHIMKSAVSVLIERGDLFLATSRRFDNTKWGFPGGKVDPGERHSYALIREVSEEVGILLSEEDVEPIFSGICRGEQDFWVTLYTYHSEEDIDDSMFAPEEGLELRWLTRVELCDEAYSPFAEYNRRAFEAYDELKEG